MHYLLYFLMICAVNAACRPSASAPGKTLQQRLDSLVAAADADIGVAILGPSVEDTFFVHPDQPYVMMSVVKFPQAVALLHLTSEGRLNPDTPVFFSQQELRRDTWSPLAETVNGKDTVLSFKHCFDWSVGQSDNIVCDRLYAFLPPQGVQAYLHSNGYYNIRIKYDYKHLSKDSLQLNSSSPRHMAMLLRDFYAGKLTDTTGRRYLLNLMRYTKTGPDRLKGQLPNTTVAHKTGTYFEQDTFIRAINDVGIVEDGAATYCIAVFVNNSREGEKRSATLIAAINRMAAEHFRARYKTTPGK